LVQPEAALTPSDTGAADKRKLHTDAKPFSEADGGAVRPAMTDLLTLRRIAREIGEFAGQHLPEEQRRALGLRLDDASYAEIARELQLSGAPAAEQLVRAAKERLRARFRGERERFGLDQSAAPREHAAHKPATQETGAREPGAPELAAPEPLKPKER
jgi:hypothetical protein